MKTDSSRNLVIGAVHGYAFEDLRPFVLSLKQTGFTGDVVLLWNSLSLETRTALEEHGVQLVHFPYRGNAALNSWSRFWPGFRPLLRLPVGESFRYFIYRKILNLAFVRYVHLFDFLKARPGKYQNIFFTDVRDVIFQDDPFCLPLPGEIVAYLEWPEIKFGADGYFNDKWLAGNYKQAVVDKLKGQRISCCGTLMTTEAGMMEYLSAFLAEVPHLEAVSHGADTSIHNVLLRYNLAGRITIAENLEHAVGTLGDKPKFAQDAEGRVLGPGGRLVPVLHQYDRQMPRFIPLLKTFGIEATR